MLKCPSFSATFAGGDKVENSGAGRFDLTTGHAAWKHFRRGLATGADASAGLIYAVRDGVAGTAGNFQRSLLFDVLEQGKLTFLPVCMRQFFVEIANVGWAGVFEGG